jgi:hypothetical protein
MEVQDIKVCFEYKSACNIQFNRGEFWLLEIAHRHKFN